MDLDPDAYIRFLSQDMDLEGRSSDLQWSVFAKWFTEEEWENISKTMEDGIILPLENKSRQKSPEAIQSMPNFSNDLSSPEEPSSTSDSPFHSDVFKFPSAVLPPTDSNSTPSLFTFNKDKSSIQIEPNAATEQPISSTSEIVVPLNSHGNKKSDHELREEFYRKEFRRQTNGRDPPRFFPTRSAFDESFIWRPHVNKQFNIDIPVYQKINGKFDDPNALTKRKRSRPSDLTQDAENLLKLPKREKGIFSFFFNFII